MAIVTYQSIGAVTTVPAAADTYDLGSTDREWRRLFMGDETDAIQFGLGQGITLGRLAAAVLGLAAGQGFVAPGGVGPDPAQLHSLPAVASGTVALTGDLDTHEAAADPHAVYQLESEKGAVNGYASLDAGGDVPDGQIPAGVERTANKGVANGYASLDSGGDVPASQLGNVTAVAAVVKTADETVNNSATLQNDDELVLALEANTRYILEGFVKAQDDGTGGLKYAFSVPTGATIEGISDTSPRWWAGGGNTMADFTVAVGSGIGSADSAQMIRAHISVGATAGNLQFQWAQNSAQVSDLRVEAGSWLMVVKE